MRIAIVCYPSIGGSGLVATTLGIELARRGHEVHFISYSVPFKLNHFEEKVFFHAVEPVNYPLFNQSLYTFALAAKIIEVVTDYNIDLVHAHYSLPHSLCAHLAREISGAPFRIVTTLHGTDVTIVGRDRPMYPINRYGIERSDTVTTVSRFQREETLRTFNIDQPIEVIYNFVDPEVFQPLTKRTPPPFAAAGDRIIMHVSNFRAPKNVAGVVEAFRWVAEAMPEALLVLVGDGPGITAVKRRCRELGICSRMRHLGKVDNVESILPYADCVFQPSYRESFGMVLLEAMACAVPTVSSNVDGIPEVVIEGETGLTAGPDDHRELANHLLRICRSAELRHRLGTAARRRAVEVFNAAKIVPQYLACYERCLAAPPTGGNSKHD